MIRSLLRARACRAAAALLACALTGAAMNGAAAQTGEPKVVVTLKPVHALVAAVIDGGGTAEALLDGTASPHAYALKPSDARRLHAADMIVRVSPALETFLAKTLVSLPSRTRIVTLDEAPGLVLHRLRTGGAFEPDAHDHGHAGHSHGAAKPASAGSDPHLWLDPVNAEVVARHVARELARLAPQHAARYEANAERLAGQLADLAKAIESTLQPAAGRPFLVFHDAYQYFERRFGLTAAGAVTVSPEVPPSARRLKQLRARLRQTRTVCVFAEPQFSPAVIDSIVEGTSVRRATLDPLGAAIPAGPRQYFALMEALARDLKACLADPA